MPLINTEVNLLLPWSANCILAPDTVIAPTFEITDTKLYVPEVTLAGDDNRKLLQQLKSGFKRSVFWNEYLPKQDDVIAANANFDFLIDPSFQGSNRHFVLALRYSMVLMQQIPGQEEVTTCPVEVSQITT